MSPGRVQGLPAAAAVQSWCGSYRRTKSGRPDQVGRIGRVGAAFRDAEAARDLDGGLDRLTLRR